MLAPHGLGIDTDQDAGPALSIKEKIVVNRLCLAAGLSTPYADHRKRGAT